MNIQKKEDARMKERWLRAGALATIEGPVLDKNLELGRALKNLAEIEKDLAAGRKTRSRGIGKGSASLAVLKKAAEARVAQLQAAHMN